MIFSTNASITANEKSREPCCFLNFLNWLSLLWVCCVKTPVNQSRGSPVTHSLLLRLNLFPTVGKLVKSGGVAIYTQPSTKRTLGTYKYMYNLSVRALVQSTCYKYAASQGVADYPALSFVLVLVHVLLYLYADNNFSWAIRLAVGW